MQFHSLIKNIPLGICRFSLDPDGKFVLANPKFLKIFRIESTDDLLGIRMRDLFHDRNDWNEIYCNLIASGELVAVEVQLTDNSGYSFWASLNAVVVDKDESEGGFWVDCTVEDIRARKLAEKRYASQMENLRQASLTLTASLDLKEVLNTIAQCALDLVPGMRNCHIFLFQSNNGDKLIFGTALWEDGKRVQPFSNPRSDGLTMKVAQFGKPILVSDMRSDPLFAGTPESWTGSIIGLPLKIGDRVVGETIHYVQKCRHG